MSEYNHETPGSDTPFQILIIGDFSGRADRGLHAPLSGRHPVRVDCDKLDEAIARMNATLQLPSGTLHFRELDDFHPDRIYRNAELFRKLEDARDRPPRAASTPPRPAPGNLLDLMVEEHTSAPVALEAGDTLADFIEKVTAPHLERKDSGKQQWSARIDIAAGEAMRAILHDPRFQAMEAAWRAVELLVQRLGPDSELRIYLLDATLQELLDNPRELAVCLAASTEPWAVIAANFTFGQSERDAMALRTLGRIAANAGAPFLAEGQPPSEDEAAAWSELRKSAEAPWIGLALPRFLLRLPYGKATSEIESFPFEEMPASVHGEYLWGNPAMACACVLGDAFREEGWQLRADRGGVTGLPQHFYKENGASVAKPCAEILLTERDAEFLLKNGLMPVASLKDQDAILLPRVQSIADPPKALRGRWYRSSR